MRECNESTVKQAARMQQSLIRTLKLFTLSKQQRHRLTDEKMHFVSLCTVTITYKNHQA